MIELLTLSNSEEFRRVTQKNLSLIAFGTPWSSPCQNQHKTLVNFAKKYSADIVIARVDVEKHPRIASKCNIQTVPTLIVYRKAREIKRLVGLQSLTTLSTKIQAIKLSALNKNAAGEADAGRQFASNAEDQ